MEDSQRGMLYEGRDMSYAVRCPRPLLLLPAVAALALGFPVSSRADITHTIARGHTIEAIAHRYHVTVKSILDANHLKDATHLKVGETLTIPGVSAKDQAGSKAKAEHGRKDKPLTYAMRSKTPGVVHATRLATSEDFAVRIQDRRGHASPVALKSFEKLMRSASGGTHPIEPRLVALVRIVSDHFGSRRLEVVSGYRPFSPTQYTAHSNHNVGRAIDFRVAGVPNEVLRDYCRTLKNVGVGYYPNSTFVHLDARDKSTFWIDYSKPGEAPRYNAPNVEADEGTSDVTDEVKLPEMPAPETETDDLPERTPERTPEPVPSAAPTPSAPAQAPSATMDD
jgi:uncharacterized protein YcbK (DUF882 family)